MQKADTFDLDDDNRVSYNYNHVWWIIERWWYIFPSKLPSAKRSQHSNVILAHPFGVINKFTWI